MSCRASCRVSGEVPILGRKRDMGGQEREGERTQPENLDMLNKKERRERTQPENLDMLNCTLHASIVCSKQVFETSHVL